MNQPENHPVLFFDGVCNLCNSSVQWILKRDPEGRFRFASLQGKLAGETLPAHGYDPADLNTVALLNQGRLYTKSAAFLQVMKALGGGWKLLYYLGSAIPNPVRNLVYDWIAKNRYRWFGKKDECMLPRPEWKLRFLD